MMGYAPITHHLLGGEFMESRNYCVYKHTAPNGKVYIGLTGKKPEYRWCNGNGYQKQDHFWRAIEKYGWVNFKHEILYSNLTKEMACQLEIYLIAIFNSNNPKFGYNKSTGGEATSKGIVVSDETKEKQRLNVLGDKNPMYGRYGELNPMYGKHHTQETKSKISEARKGKYSGENNPMYGKSMPLESRYWLGKHLPDDIKEKISKSHDKDKKPVGQYDKDTGELLNIYSSIMEASKMTGANDSAIIRVCKGKQHTSLGFVWKYL